MPSKSSPIVLAYLGNVLRSLVRREDLDNAVVYALLTRAWQFLAGPITLLFIANFFTGQEQGFYYTFASLAALQSFVELGFFIVIINTASHEWASLSLSPHETIEGDHTSFSRLVTLGRLAFKWYGVISLIFVVGVGMLGMYFFSDSSTNEVHWQSPWWALVILTGILLWASPFNSILEGCGQIGTVNQVRLQQAIVSSLALWLTIWMGGGLWAAVALAGTCVLRDFYLIFIQYRGFFASFLKPCPQTGLSWKKELLPLQWRVGLSGFTSYFAFFLFNPVMFHYHGANVAGQMGMTLQIVSAMQMGAIAWVQTKIPGFGVLISKKQYGDLDQLWLRTLSVTFILLFCGAVSFWFFIYLIDIFDVGFSERLLKPLPTAFLLLAAILMHISYCQSAYLRAHKRDPIVIMSVTSSLAIGVLVWFLGKNFGPTGATAGYLFVAACYIIPYETFIWFRCRKQWHKSER